MGHIDSNQVSSREEYAEPEMSEEANASAADAPGDNDAQSDEIDDTWNTGDFQTDEETDEEETDSQDGDMDKERDLEVDLDDD